MSLIIGTAQFSGTYGVTNKKKKITPKYLNQVAEILKKNNIKFIDTAQSYNVESLIGKTKLKNFNFITKIYITKKFNEKKIYSSLIKSLYNLKIKKFHAILIHDPENLSKKNIKKIKSFLLKLKKNSITKKIGLSIYESKHVKNILPIWVPDIVQLPVNILNRDLYNSGLINELNTYNIEIHARSVFLQGLLLADKIPIKFKRWKKIFEKWSDLTENNINKKIIYSLNLIKKYMKLKNIIIGFDDIGQLKKIISLYKNKNKINRKTISFFSNKKKLIDIRNW